MCVCVCCHPVWSERLVCRHTSRSHTGGRSLRISSPPPNGAYRSFNTTRLQLLSCTPIVKSDFVYERINHCPLVGLCPIQAAIRCSVGNCAWTLMISTKSTKCQSRWAHIKIFLSRLDIQYFYFRNQDCNNTFIDYDVFCCCFKTTRIHY